MSRTKRIKIHYKGEELLTNQRDKKNRISSTFNKRMKSYATERGKFGVDKMTGNYGSCFQGNKVSETSKIVTKNANRSLKNGYRQQLKRELEELLNNKL